MTPDAVRLRDRRVWLRVADPEWSEPLDPSCAGERGGRWNPPGSFATLYLNGDAPTALMQIEQMLAGTPVTTDDLDDDAYVLVAATLPRSQVCADATTAAGLRRLGLPETYPRTSDGRPIGHAPCQQLGEQIHAQRLRGVWSRSACTPDGRGRELAWFPASRRSNARAVWATPLPFGRWRHPSTWADLGLDEQADPRPVARDG